MKRFVLISTLCLALVFAVSAMADQHPARIAEGGLVENVMQMSKAQVCTTILLESDFETNDWQGWYGYDRTFNPEHRWSVTDDPNSYGLVVDGTKSLWCGVYAPATWICGADKPSYGNGWEEAIIYTYTVDDNSVTSNVNWTFDIRVDVEEADGCVYDRVYAEWNQAGTWVEVARFCGAGLENFDSGTAIVYTTSDYVGTGLDQIQLRIRIFSDSGWSDEDGSWCTDLGACQVDNIVVTLNSVEIENEDFESIDPCLPGESLAFGNWIPYILPGVGDFALLWENLGDDDMCRDNYTWQAAFIDAGQIPGVGPTLGVAPYDYGPSGYIVNYAGGMMGPDYFIWNSIFSPVFPVAPQSPCTDNIDAVLLHFDIYMHLPLYAGMFYTWEVRSTDTGNPDDVLGAGWTNDNYVRYSNNPTYARSQWNVSGYLTGGRTHMQVALSINEYGWVWGFQVDSETTPAPYFDNVRVVGYPFLGPSITFREVDIAQDNFVDGGLLDLEDLGSNWIRFDMARNIASSAAQVNRPGDSCYVDVTIVRAGFEVYDAPKMFFTMRANPLFTTAMRTGLSDPDLYDIQQIGDVISGWTYLKPCINNQGNPVPNRWIYDLPDTAFFYPGDIIHYYIEAYDWDGVDEGSIGASRLGIAADYFGNFHANWGSNFIVRGLPSLYVNDPTQPVSEENPILQPKILWWNDAIGYGGDLQWLSWYNALQGLDYQHTPQRGPGDYDIYDTTAPSSLVGNGLGHRATFLGLEGYDVILYSSATLTAEVLGAQSWTGEPSDDIGELTRWLDLGDEENPKKMFMTGDNLAYSLNALNVAGFPAAATFLNDVLGVNYYYQNVRAYIDGQYSPTIKPVPGNGVIEDTKVWDIEGGCPVVRTFDGVDEVEGQAQRIAYFEDLLGADTYPFAAAVYNVHPNNYGQIVFMPYDFQHIDRADTVSTVRQGILEDILKVRFQQTPITSAPDALFAVSNFPNPFNPATTIKLSLPRNGQVSLKVFNVRGELVKTLVNGQMTAGEHSIIWDGTNDRGAPAASGIYFYETRAGNEMKVGKMALVK